MVCAQKECQLSTFGMLLHLSILQPPALRGGGTLATQKEGKGSNVDDREVGGIQHNFRLTVCEDNEATVKIALKRRSPAMRHISRTHRVNLEWVYEAFQHPEI